jgi:hypothetical protein
MTEPNTKEEDDHALDVLYDFIDVYMHNDDRRRIVENWIFSREVAHQALTNIGILDSKPTDNSPPTRRWAHNDKS